MKVNGHSNGRIDSYLTARVDSIDFQMGECYSGRLNQLRNFLERKFDSNLALRCLTMLDNGVEKYLGGRGSDEEGVVYIARGIEKMFILAKGMVLSDSGRLEDSIRNALGKHFIPGRGTRIDNRSIQNEMFYEGIFMGANMKETDLVLSRREKIEEIVSHGITDGSEIARILGISLSTLVSFASKYGIKLPTINVRSDNIKRIQSFFSDGVATYEEMSKRTGYSFRTLRKYTKEAKVRLKWKNPRKRKIGKKQARRKDPGWLRVYESWRN